MSMFLFIITTAYIRNAANVWLPRLIYSSPDEDSPSEVSCGASFSLSLSSAFAEVFAFFAGGALAFLAGLGASSSSSSSEALRFLLPLLCFSPSKGQLSCIYQDKQ